MLRVISKIRYYVKVFLIVILIPALYHFIPMKKGEEFVYISSKKMTTTLSELEDAGYGITFVDYIFLLFSDHVEPGWYQVKSLEEGRFNLLEQITKHEAHTISVKVFAGETSQEITSRLANDLNLDSQKLLMYYRMNTKFLEGDIFAKRYNIPRGANEKSVMKFLFSKSDQEIKRFGEVFCEQEPNKLEIKFFMIIASIIQKETNSKEEMYLISSVIHNRLNRGMRLQMDGTLNYGDKSHKVVTPKTIKNDNSYFNTYKHGGLPPMPIASVSIDALQASYNPAITQYLYFMLQKDGTHAFANTYEEHIVNVKKFKN